MKSILMMAVILAGQAASAQVSDLHKEIRAAIANEIQATHCGIVDPYNTFEKAELTVDCYRKISPNVSDNYTFYVTTIEAKRFEGHGDINNQPLAFSGILENGKVKSMFISYPEMD